LVPLDECPDRHESRGKKMTLNSASRQHTTRLLATYQSALMRLADLAGRERSREIEDAGRRQVSTAAFVVLRFYC
jgi:hypothetical protein